MDELSLRSATELEAAIRDRSISSRELLELYLQRVDRLNPSLNAVVTLDADRALAAAKRADDRTVAGDELGPLHGLPVTIKDAIETAGIRSTGGARELADHVPAADAPAVARLRAAGAIVYGKTNVPKWSGDIQTFNDLFGVTNNPWDLSRTSGGSSGGPAVAVAAGLTSFELGTDIGGSIRIPSSYCGVFGHKPSFGIVSQRGYLDRVGGGVIDADINVFGPLARHAADLEVLLDVLAGPNVEDAIGWRLQLPGPRHHDLSGYRIGLWLDDPAAEIDTEIGDALSAAAGALAAAGAHVHDARPEVALTDAVRLFNGLLLPAISPSIEPEVGEAVEREPPEVAGAASGPAVDAAQVGRLVHRLRRPALPGHAHGGVPPRQSRRHQRPGGHDQRAPSQPGRDAGVDRPHRRGLPALHGCAGWLHR